ncbi:MAG: hypothetical protein JXR11_06855 [Balneola sp.]
MEFSLEIVFFLVLLFTLLEVLLSYKFVGWYFEYGIPLRFYTTKILYPLKQVPTQEDIQNSILDSKYVGIDVKKIDENTFAFRESYSFRSNKKRALKEGYTQVIRGNLYFDIENDIVRMKALVNWYAISFLFFFALLGFTLAPAIGFFTAIWILFDISIYSTQIERYKHLARMAASIGHRQESVA